MEQDATAIANPARRRQPLRHHRADPHQLLRLQLSGRAPGLLQGRRPRPQLPGRRDHPHPDSPGRAGHRHPGQPGRRLHPHLHPGRPVHPPSSRPGGRVHHPRVRDNRPFGRVPPDPRARPGCSRPPGLPAPGHRPARRVSLVRPIRWPVRNLRFCGQQPLLPPGRLTVGTRMLQSTSHCDDKPPIPETSLSSARGCRNRSVEQGAMMARSVIRSGDTFGAIAARFGVTLAALKAANPQITDPNRIFPGQVITIPGSSPAPGPAYASRPATPSPPSPADSA